MEKQSKLGYHFKELLFFSKSVGTKLLAFHIL
jgi:hypothetical protein